VREREVRGKSPEKIYFWLVSVLIVVRSVKPTHLMDLDLDRLFSTRLINRKQHENLSNMKTTQERVSALLIHILPRKGPGSYDKFVEVLEKTEGQEHIVEHVLKHEDRDSEGDAIN